MPRIGGESCPATTFIAELNRVVGSILTVGWPASGHVCVDIFRSFDFSVFLSFSAQDKFGLPVGPGSKRVLVAP